jgi:hypothetical protein
MNVPFKMIDAADLKVYTGGNGDLALAVPRSQRIGYLITWPHLRPGYITRPQPSLRSIPDAERAAKILGEALAADANQTVTPISATPTRVADPRPRSIGPQPAALA